MGFIWLSATTVCALMTALFCATLLYYMQTYHVTWRVVALVSVIVFWIALTRAAFLKFRGHISK